MMRIKVIQGDITTMAGDAIVNAANRSLLGGGGVDGAIHRKGGGSILEECKKIRARQGGCPTGEAVHTGAGNLSVRYVIHTVGPVWEGGGNNEAVLLANCYRNSLGLAEKLGVKTLFFPNISTGVYAFPKDSAAKIAVETVRHFVGESKSIEETVFVCFDRENLQIYLELLPD